MEYTDKHGRKPGKGRKRKKGSIGKKILAGILGLALVGMLVVAVMVGLTANKIGKIDIDTLYSHIEQSSYIYDVNDELVDTLHYSQDRKIVSINDMPDDLKHAFIAIEDKTFYKHHGFNFRRMIGAIIDSFLHRTGVSGTSTITQQLARNVYLADIKSQRSIRRKLSEMYIAFRLEQALTKDQILEAYLNTIYLGYGNYGVNAAARTYFSKNVNELDLAECAALAALPQAPDTYAFITTEAGEGRQKLKDITYYSLDEVDDKEDKVNEAEEQNGSFLDYILNNGNTTTEEEEESDTAFYSNDAAKGRRETVLDLMAAQGYISKDEAEKAKVDITEILKPSFEKSESKYSWFIDYAADQITKDLVEEYKITEEEALRMVYTGGLKIYTTLDRDIQDTVYKEFQDDYNFPTAENDAPVEASMVITQVGTGEVRAMVGGREAGGAKSYNRALSPRQPGSSIKPFSVYGAALQRSYELAERGEKFPFVDMGYDTQGDKYWGDYITASSTVLDERMTVNGEEWPKNATRTYSGRRTVRTALQQSINTCAVKILWQVGLDYSMDLLKDFDLSTVVTDKTKEVNDNNPAALALGAMAYGVTPLDMALAYGAFPNNGVKNTAVCYREVRDNDDKTILTGESEEKKVLDEGVAWIMTDMLKTVVSNGIGRNATISGIQVGGKTGTTNDFYDVWFDGFTPDYSAALWIGTDKNIKMNGTSAQAARLWGKIMGQIDGVTNGIYKDKPENIVQQNGEYYTKGTEKNAGSPYSGEKKEDEEEKSEAEVKPEVPAETPKNPEQQETPEETPEDKKEQDQGTGDKEQGGETTPPETPETPEETPPGQEDASAQAAAE